MVRGEGTRVYDANGTEYFDGLSGLFTNALGHGRARHRGGGGRADRRDGLLSRCGPTPTRGPSSWPRRLAAPRAGRSQSRLLHLWWQPRPTRAPGSSRVSTTRCAATLDRYKVISRDVAYHGTTLGRAHHHVARAATASPSSPSCPAPSRCPRSNFYRAERYGDDFEAFGLWQAHQIEEAILREGPETIAAVFLEPVQNAGGCFAPPPNYWQAVREICDRYGVLLVSDDVICGVRSHRYVVRWAEVRLRARHHHVRQGHHRRLRPAGRDDRLGPHGRAVPCTATSRSCTASPGPATRPRAPSP